jgi:hypothetical protein
MTSYFVSAELSSFLGTNAGESIPRHQIENKILSYAKDKNLVNQHNSMVIRADETLQTLMNGKNVFGGFSIIPYLKHHLVARDDSETISESSQTNQMDVDEESNDEESNDEEENQEVTVRRVILQDPSGNELTFEASNHENIRIQRNFVISNEEFCEIANTLCPQDKNEEPYERLAFLIMFIITLLSFSLWLSILNARIERV